MASYAEPDDYKRRLAMTLAQNSFDTSPKASWAQGLAQLAQAWVGGSMMKDQDTEDATSRANTATSLAKLYPGSTAAPAAPLSLTGGAPKPAGNPGWGDAIAGIESGGKYDALGPVTKSGDRAYGKYQMMGANIGPWSKAHLGQEMTPDQFIANPEAQDKIFQGQFGQYAQKYGPEGASKAWFAGEGGMNNPNAKDMLGTTVADYSRKFMAAGGNNALVGGDQIAPQATAPQPQTPIGDKTQTALSIVMDPRADQTSRQLASKYLEQQTPEYTYHSTPTGEMIRTDKRGGAPQVVFRSPTKPDFREVENPDGTKRSVWINPTDRSITDANVPGAQPAGPSTIPAAPAGVDPKIWRKDYSERSTKDSLPATSDDTSKLRNEIQGLPSYKNLAQAAPVYRSMAEAAGRDTRAADVNMIYGLAKVMDPGSVVRESEMTVAQAIATLPEQLRNAAASQMSGSGRLSPDIRAAIMQEAHSRIGSYQSMFDQDATMYRGIATDSRMNPAHVLPNFGKFDPWQPQQPMQGNAPRAAQPQGWSSVPEMPGVTIRQVR